MKPINFTGEAGSQSSVKKLSIRRSSRKPVTVSDTKRVKLEAEADRTLKAQKSGTRLRGKDILLHASESTAKGDGHNAHSEAQDKVTLCCESAV